MWKTSFLGKISAFIGFGHEICSEFYFIKARMESGSKNIFIKDFNSKCLREDETMNSFNRELYTIAPT